jgi:hypothetical protein
VVASSSRPAAAARPVITSWAPLALRRCPRWLRKRAGVICAPGHPGRSSSQPASAVRSCGWIGMSRTRSPLP